DRMRGRGNPGREGSARDLLAPRLPGPHAGRADRRRPRRVHHPAALGGGRPPRRDPRLALPGLQPLRRLYPPPGGLHVQVKRFAPRRLAARLAAAPGCGVGRGAAPHVPSPAQAAAPGFPLTITDDSGRRVPFARPPRAIISLAPSHTETL